MRGRTSLLALAAGLVLAAPAPAADHPVAFGGMLGRAYSPSDVTIAAGDSVTFSGSFSDHPLHWDSEVFGRTDSGPSKQFVFAHPGTYTYYCELHGSSDNMRGVI